MKSKWIAFFVTVAMFFGSMHVLAVGFDDVGEAHAWAKAEIENYAQRGILAGDGKGNFMPDDNVTRAEFAKMLCLVFELESAAELTYSDLDKNGWQYDYIAKTDAYTFSPSSDTYEPNKPATRAEIAYAIVNAAGFDVKEAQMPFSDIDETDTALLTHVKTAYALGILKGYPDNTFRPNASVTRAEAVVLLSRAEQLYAESVAKQEPLRDDEAVKLDVTALRDLTDEISEINTIACVRSVVKDVYLPGHQQPKVCIKLYLTESEELGCVFMDELAVYRNGSPCNSTLDCGDIVYFEKKFNGTISKVHILWDMDDKGKKNGNDYIYSNVGYKPNTEKKSERRFWNARGVLDENGKRATNELRIMYAPKVTVNAKTISIGGYAVSPDTRVLVYSRYTKDAERYRSVILNDLDLTNPERKEIFNSIVNTPENMKLVKTFFLHWEDNVLTDIIVVQDVQFE